MASEPNESERPPKADGRPKAAQSDRTVPLEALPASLRKLLEETPVRPSGPLTTAEGCRTMWL